MAQLYHHVAPRSEVSIVAKAMIRLLRSHREVQDIVLTCVAAIATHRKVRQVLYQYILGINILTFAGDV